MNWLEKIKDTISTKDARKAANDHKIAVKEFMDEMQRERAIICTETFCTIMKRQMKKVHNV